MCIDHVVGHLGKCVNEPHTEIPIINLLGQGLRHAQHPLIALLRANGIRVVAHAKARMAFPGDVQRWPTKPARQKFKQVFFAAQEVFRMHLAHGVGLGQLVHQFVKTVGQALHGGGATQGVVGIHGRILNGFHATSCGCGVWRSTRPTVPAESTHRQPPRD